MMDVLHTQAEEWAFELKKSGKKHFELRSELTKTFSKMLSIYLLGDDINDLRFPVLFDDSKGNIECR